MLAATRELFSGIESHHNGLASIQPPGLIGACTEGYAKIQNRSLARSAGILQLRSESAPLVSGLSPAVRWIAHILHLGFDEFQLVNCIDAERFASLQNRQGVDFVSCISQDLRAIR